MKNLFYFCKLDKLKTRIAKVIDKYKRRNKMEIDPNEFKMAKAEQPNMIGAKYHKCPIDKCCYYVSAIDYELLPEPRCRCFKEPEKGSNKPSCDYGQDNRKD